MTFYDAPFPLASNKVKKKEDMENNLLRRWKVEIFDIQFTNKSGDVVNPFVQFIIGGDYRIEYKKTSSGGVVKEEKGNMGLVFKSNVIKNMGHNESETFTTHIVTEFRTTYYEIIRNRLHFEIWTWNNWGLNKFLAIKSIRLLDVVTGSINRELYFSRSSGKKEEAICQLSFKVKFEEIWDFNINMLDWQADDIKKQGK